MKGYYLIFSLITSLIFPSLAQADRTLQRTEILRILENLTDNPTKTWITSGEITARHYQYSAPKTLDEAQITQEINTELQAYLNNPDKPQLTEQSQQMKQEAIPFNVRYELSNESTMTSDVTVKFDQDRFYWEIKVKSRTDSVTPPAQLSGNDYTGEFDLQWNTRRIFAWDGQKYTTYFLPGNHATITNSPGNVNGPLTAGLIPWGIGIYRLDILAGLDLSGYQTQTSAQPEVHLTIPRENRQESLVLDPEKNYATLLYSVRNANNRLLVREYSDYRLVNEKWVPGKITIEQFDTENNPPGLLTKHIWDFNSISYTDLPPEHFQIDFEYDALIEDFRFGPEPLMYRYIPPQEPTAENIELDKLIDYRLEMNNCAGTLPQNCATAALKYVCDKLDRQVSWKQLSSLVHGPKRKTNLAEMLNFGRENGLSAQAVSTDMDTIAEMPHTRAILHLPGRNHFVILAGADPKSVRLIDITGPRLLYSRNMRHLKSLWEGTALLVCRKAVFADKKMKSIPASDLPEILGAGNCQKCNTKIQDSADYPCNSTGSCGSHTIQYERYECGSGTGTCSESGMIKKKTEPCTTDPNTGDCVGTGSWSSSNISACK